MPDQSSLDKKYFVDKDGIANSQAVATVAATIWVLWKQ